MESVFYHPPFCKGGCGGILKLNDHNATLGKSARGKASQVTRSEAYFWRTLSDEGRSATQHMAFLLRCSKEEGKENGIT